MMKWTLVLSVVILFRADGDRPFAAAANLKDDDLQTLLEKFFVKAKAILEGNDPYNYGGSASSSNSYGTVFNGSIANVIISGQSSMNVTHLKVIEDDPHLNFSLGLTFRGLMMTGNYGLYLDLLTMMKLYGSGEMGTKASLLGVNITALITQDPTVNNTLQFEDLAIHLDVPQLMVDVKNLLDRPGLSAYASNILDDVLPSLLSEPKLEAMLSSYVRSALNPLMVQHEVNLALVREFIEKLIE